MSYVAVLLLLSLLLGTWALLDRNHHRTAGVPHAPLGADAVADSDLWRVRHDLEVTPRSPDPPAGDR